MGADFIIDAIDHDDLTRTVMEAVRATWAELRRLHPNEHFNGYALCTDDCLMTLYHVASTIEFCERYRTAATHPYDPPEFAPVEWTYSGGADLFEPASRLLISRYKAAGNSDDSENGVGFEEEASFSKHVDDSFACLVSALRQLKSEGLFPEAVFLDILSTDPSPHLERLEERAGRRLNSERLFAQHRAGSRRGRLIHEAKAAVTHSLRGRPSASEVSGYVLLTNDHIKTVRPALCTNARHRVERPEAWPEFAYRGTFETLRRSLASEWEPYGSWESPWAVESRCVNESFDALVTALGELRDDGMFGEEVFLAVLSEDRSGYLDRMEDEAAKRLNSSSLYSEWKHR